MKHLQLICLAAFIMLFSCNSDDDNGTMNNESQPISIIGEWKLMSIEFFAHGYEFVNYSDENIIFNFKSNNTLTISGNDEEPFYIYPSGEYDYIILEIQDDNPYTCPFEVTITNIEFCTILNGVDMILSQTASDGGRYSFIKYSM